MRVIAAAGVAMGAVLAGAVLRPATPDAEPAASAPEPPDAQTRPGPADDASATSPDGERVTLDTPVGLGLRYRDVLGTYTLDDAGDPTNVCLQANGQATVDGWMPLGMSIGTVDVRWSHGALALTRAADPSEQVGPSGLTVGRWGDEVVLIDGGDNGLSWIVALLRTDPRDPSKLVFRRSGATGRLAGLPELPEPWAGRLRAPTIVAHVLRLLPQGTGVCAINRFRRALDRGATDGVYEHMKFGQSTANGWQSLLTVTRVMPRECEVQALAAPVCTVGDQVDTGTFRPR